MPDTSMVRETLQNAIADLTRQLRALEDAETADAVRAEGQPTPAETANMLPETIAAQTGTAATPNQTALGVPVQDRTTTEASARAAASDDDSDTKKASAKNK